PKEFDPLNIRENIKKIIDAENIRNRGFNTAVNSLTAILDTSKMGYQFIENLKNARELVVREYEDTDVNNLPDERYQMRLKYFDQEQLLKERDAYDKQMDAFRVEITHMWDVVNALYDSNKSGMKVNDFDDVAKRMRGRIRRAKQESGDPIYEEVEKTWNEILRIKAEDTDVERLNQTYLHEKALLKKMLGRSQERVSVIYGHLNPKERVEVDKRIEFLRREFEEFDYLINPYHIQPGLILDVDITSIKRKKFTLNGMANVLNEFLHGVSKGFQDAAFATFKRRRSTIREDLNQSFGSAVDEDIVAREPEIAHFSAADDAEEASDAGVKGKADVTPSRRRRKADDLQEL
ncbi:MAG: cytochrome C oxidase subunit II, partial [Spirochaetaceae bacterium]